MPLNTKAAKPSKARRRAARSERDGNGASEPFVVGVGASAGGLQALQAFFGAMKEPPNAAFVVVQHLSPDFKSFMVELLAKHTRMPVQRAEHNAHVKPGNIYLIPPKVTLTIAKGRLRLVKTDPRRGLHLPIDQFFFSLAQDQQQRSVAVVLSGTGSDGTAGIRAVKDAGGMVMVQSEDSAQFDGMPRSAIATGLADYVLPPDKMATQLISYLSHPILANSSVRGVGRRGRDVHTVLTEIFNVLRTQCGVDFSHYKPATIDRRIERRMSVCQIGNLSDYARHLNQSPREAALLFNELLIGVTSFFRDPATWERLETDILPSLLRALPAHETFRAWVAGCSTGEEAYSLAILVAEQMDRMKLHRSVKIFATDISKSALVTAARGHYTPSEVTGISAERLQNFFIRESNGFRVTTRIREMVVFANHNLLSDPPFTRLSLIACRNLLIYLQTAMQQRLLTLFSFALRDDGVLFLGGSESIGDATDRFQPLFTRANLYRNRRGRQPPPVMASGSRVARTAAETSTSLQRAAARVTAGEAPSLDEIQKQILSEFTPPCLVIDARDEILHIVGEAGDYLKLGEGGFTRNIFKLTAHNLANALRSALVRAQQKGDRFTYENVQYREGRKFITVRIHVRPLPDRQGKPSGLRLVFIERMPQPKAAQSKASRSTVEKASARRITDLERDLSLTRDTLQATVQDLETSNEEIQAANEELLAANEELQSTNEELQSVNEELHTVNTENQSRIEELTRLTNDINNLLATASIGVVLIDSQLRIRRASRSALVLLDLTEADVGVPIETVARILHDSQLPGMVERVIRDAQPEEREIERGPIGRGWLLLRCVPFRNEVGRTQGAVLTFIDMTERHAAEHRQLAQAAVMQAVLDAMEANVAVVDADGRIVHVNKNWRTAGTNGGTELPDLQVGTNYFEVAARHAGTGFGDPAWIEALQKVLRGELPHFFHDYASVSPAGRRWYRLHAVPVNAPSAGVAIAHFNITPMKQAEDLLASRVS